MRVKVKSDLRGASLTANVGEIIEVDVKTGEALVACGAAESLEPARIQVEAIAPQETATLKRGRPKKVTDDE